MPERPDGGGPETTWERSEVLVMGIGNVLWADEGFGIRAVERLEREWWAPPGVTLLDGGTQGLYLVPFVQAAQRLLIFDAIDFGDPPGQVRVVRGDDVPRFGGVRKMSLHQTGFQEVLELAGLLGARHEAVTLIGVQTVVLDDFGGSLSPLVAGRLEEALELGRQELAAWGFPLRSRAAPLPPDRSQVGAALERGAYEQGRPSEALAFRGGDARFWMSG